MKKPYEKRGVKKGGLKRGGLENQKQKNEAQIKLCNKKRDDYDNKKFALLMIIPIVSIIAASISIHNEKYSNFMIGIIFGSALTVIVNTFSNWDKMGALIKIFVLLISISVLGWISVK
mgnify:CR=1 FL=1